MTWIIIEPKTGGGIEFWRGEVVVHTLGPAQKSAGVVGKMDHARRHGEHE